MNSPQHLLLDNTSHYPHQLTTGEAVYGKGSCLSRLDDSRSVMKRMYRWPCGGYGHLIMVIDSIETSQSFMPFVACSTAT